MRRRSIQTSSLIPAPVAITAPTTATSFSDRTIAVFRVQLSGSLIHSSRPVPGTTTQVTLAITNWSVCTPTSNKFTVSINADACTNTPGGALGQAIATAAASPCGTARARIAVPLTAGQKYWVVVVTSPAPTQIATTAVWWETNTAWSDYNLNDGNGCRLFLRVRRAPSWSNNLLTSIKIKSSSRGRLRELVLFCGDWVEREDQSL